MKKLFQKLDPAYLKVALYAGGTVLVTFFVGLALYSALPALSKFSSLVLAVLRPMLVGFVIWYLLLPAVKKIEGALAKRFGEKKGLRGIAVLICFLVILAVIAIFLIVISQAFVSQINFSSIVNLVQGTETDLQEFINQAISYLERFNIKIPNIGSSLTGVVSSIASSTTTFFFGIIFSIYFLIDADRLRTYWRNAAQKIFPKRTIARFHELLGDADVCFSGYIRGQVTDAILVGAVVSIVFSFMKMKYALVIGLLAGIGNLIPYVGPALGYISVILVNLIAGDFRMLVIGLVVLEAIMLIDGNIINPRLLAGTIKVHPLLVIASLLAGGAIGGLLGMLLAVPTGAFIRMQFEKWLAKKEPPEEPEAEPAE